MLDSFSFLTARENRTAQLPRKKTTPRNSLESSFINQRPNTTFLGRTHNSYAYKSIDEAEQELSSTFREQMTSFVKTRIRKLTNKNKEIVCVGESIGLTFNPQQTIKSTSKPRNIRQMRMSSLSYGSPRKTEEVVGQPYIINARQKLARLVAKKKETEQMYQTIQVKVKQKQKQKIRIRRKKDSMFRNPQHVNNIEWDSQWRKQAAKEVNRYRTRLSVKHKKTSSALTIEW